VVRSKAYGREGALEVEPAAARVRGVAGRWEVAGRVSMRLGSSCSWVDSAVEEGGTAQGSTATGILPGG